MESLLFNMENKKEFYKITIDDTSYESQLTPKFLRRKPYVPFDEKKIHSIIPGIIREINVRKGQTVKRNERLLTLEAMKMNNAVRSPKDGVIKDIHVKTGEMVPKASLWWSLSEISSEYLVLSIESRKRDLRFAAIGEFNGHWLRVIFATQAVA